MSFPQPTPPPAIASEVDPSSTINAVSTSIFFICISSSKYSEIYPVDTSSRKARTMPCPKTGPKIEANQVKPKCLWQTRDGSRRLWIG